MVLKFKKKINLSPAINVLRGIQRVEWSELNNYVFWQLQERMFSDSNISGRGGGGGWGGGGLWGKASIFSEPSVITQLCCNTHFVVVVVAAVVIVAAAVKR